MIIFQGDKDVIVSQEYTEKAAKFYQNVKIEMFPGEGHGFSEQASQKVMEMTHKFVVGTK